VSGVDRFTGIGIDEVVAEARRLDALVNSPSTSNFLESVRTEIAHQIERWSTAHDRGKAPADWFWLVGYLAGKALAAHVNGDSEKALHHTISTAAALANWHAAITLGSSKMQPGHADIQQYLEQTFGQEITASEEGPLLRPLAEWHEDMHDVIWYRVEDDGEIVGEPPKITSPLSSDWPLFDPNDRELGLMTADDVSEDPGTSLVPYYTHFLELPKGMPRIA